MPDQHTGRGPTTNGVRLVVTTPWYPGVNNAFAGSFVQGAVQAVRSTGRVGDVRIVHSEDWPTPSDRFSAALVRRALRALATGPDGSSTLAVARVTEGELLRVPTPVRAGAGFADHALVHESSVRAALDGRPLEADVVHGHVGLVGGWVATRLAAPGVPVVVTEHATFLDRVLAQPAARDMYDEVIGRSDRFLCVSGVLRTVLLDTFPHHADRVEVLPNAVAIERMPLRGTPVTQLKRWLYVGRLLPHKGVRRLLEAFARCAADDDEVELTLLGDGRLGPELAARAADLGLADRVHLPGAVPHERVVEQMHSQDLLVHLSEYETFGMTVVEAVAAGLPVLVTRSGGPEETLEGLEEISGATVGTTGAADTLSPAQGGPTGRPDVVGGVDEVVEAYRALAADVSRLDLSTARARMQERYSQQAVGRRLLDVYTGSTPATRAGPAGPATPEVRA